MNSNLLKLMSNLPEGVDAALIESPVNRRYYTGFPSSAGVLVVFRDEAYFIIDFRYIEAAKANIKGCTVILQGKRNEQIKELLNKHDAKRIAVEATRMTVSALDDYRRYFEGFEFVADGSLDKLINAHRAVKSLEEYKTMCAAANIADKAFEQICGFIRPGVTEQEIATELCYYMRKLGGEGESFDTIVVSGPNGSKPHGVPGERKITAGDFITIDFGTIVNGYVSDMTRTVAVGHATDEMHEVYNVVLEAQQAAFDVIKPGILCKDVDAVARKVITDAGYGQYFGHSLGHSLGLEVHEGPNFSSVETATAKEGLLLSVEPGIYIEGKFGVRIEDTVWITADGFKNLAHSPKELIIL